ncbi:hypothetical protein FZEAL_7573 [Fusarium zealandicum]|uniref:NACHT domain-containing protein n=1 Tax=Fusarium zealandicum TaxID=1053134 RepID=A0A8H4UFM5_9HYPO|nr:hypothetical protein FZEAL_7573 [Fusarium zealandicum]
MAQRMIERACDRFRREISLEEATLIETTTTIDDVKLAIRQVEQQLAARQLLRDMDRVIPFIDAIERYSKALDVAANGTPYLPWIWAPIKFVLQAAQDYTHALDKILSAYGDIGLQMPRFSRFVKTFPKDHTFQRLVAFLFEDILEFHRQAYAMIRKPGWKIFFKSAWGGFDHRFGSLLNSISRISDQIDREAMSIDISQAAEQRQKEAEEATQRVERWRNQQRDIVLNWLETSATEQENKLEMLRGRCHEGTLQWVTKSPKLRGWLQRGHGKQVLWLYGKPGSGKSVLGAQLVSFLRADTSRNVCFFFCDFNTPTSAASGHIFRAITAQIVHLLSTAAPYLYSECVAKGQKPTADVLKRLLPGLLSSIDDIRLIVDGVDEISTSEHRKLLSDMLFLTKGASGCKLLLISQDIPSISVQLSKQPRFSMADETINIQKDISAIVEHSLREIDSQHEGALGETVLQDLLSDVLNKAEGMFLWVHLVLELLRNASCIEDLRLQISSLPATLAEAYGKILNSICSRCSEHDIARIRRVFAWLRYQKGKRPLRKHQIRIGISLFPGRDTLNERTNPLPNATDICKPLIEGGPDGSLVFVHSTVAQFLDKPDAPFINKAESQASIAYACICQVFQGLDLLTLSSTSTSAIAIASGFLSLWPYANELWVEHLLDCFEVEHAAISASIQAVVDRANLLCLKLQVLSPLGSCEGSDSPDNSGQDKRWSNLAKNTDPCVMDLMINLQNVPGPSNRDQPPLTQAMGVYQSIVKSLMQGNGIDGISQESLLAFKELHGPTAFLCNIRGCERAVAGFSSMYKLKDHQALHSGELQCPEGSCAYNDVGFSSIRSLQQHKKKHHGAARLEQVPKRLRRVGKLHREMLSNELNDEDRWVCISNPQAARKLKVNWRQAIETPRPIVNVQFSPDGKKIAAGSDKGVFIFDADSGAPIQVLEHGLISDDGYMGSICFSPDGDYLATTSNYGNITIWDLESGYKEFIDGLGESVHSVCYAPDGSTIASGGEDHTVCLWDVQTRACITTLDLPNLIWSIAFSPNGKYMAAGCSDGNAYIYHTKSASLFATLHGHIDSVSSVAFSPDSNQLATGSKDFTLKIWELSDPPSCLETLEGHKECVSSVVFTPNGRWVVSGSDDQEVRFWDAKTGESQVTLTGHATYVTSVAVSPTGNNLATADGSGTLGIWTLQEL